MKTPLCLKMAQAHAHTGIDSGARAHGHLHAHNTHRYPRQGDDTHWVGQVPRGSHFQRFDQPAVSIRSGGSSPSTTQALVVAPVCPAKGTYIGARTCTQKKNRNTHIHTTHMQQRGAAADQGKERQLTREVTPPQKERPGRWHTPLSSAGMCTQDPEHGAVLQVWHRIDIHSVLSGRKETCTSRPLTANVGV